MVEFIEMNDELLKHGPLMRVLMVAPTSFFADYGCHVRILDEARALQALDFTSRGFDPRRVLACEFASLRLHLLMLTTFWSFWRSTPSRV